MSPRYRFGPFSLDSDTHQLFRDAQVIPLTPKAFDLLMLLVRSQGRTVSKDEILREVWKEEQYVEEWNLSQNIYTLRNTLGDSKNRPQYIETVPRRGFRFVAKVNLEEAERAARNESDAQLVFKQITFRRGAVFNARFSPEGNVVYSAAFDGNRARVYLTNPESDPPESRSLDFDDIGLLSVSSTKELALSLHQRPLRGYIRKGTLCRTSIFSNSHPRELLEHVQEADWSPDGDKLAVVREVSGRSRLEYPADNILYETGGWISHPRFSPRGDLIAFIDHPLQNDDRGSIAVIDLEGNLRQLSTDWISALGLAWTEQGDEVWFTATKLGNSRALYAVTLKGEERLVKRTTGALTLRDISSRGDVLMTRQSTRVAIIGRAPDETRERDLSWLDWSLARDLSPDGSTLLFTEAGEGGGASYGVYIRGTDGSDAVRLGSGSALALSPDGRWALSRMPSTPAQMVLLPVASGAPVMLERAPLSYQQWACWFPDGERILFTANEGSRGTQLFVQNINGGSPRCVTPNVEGIYLTSPTSISPDAKRVAVVGSDDRVYIFGLENKELEAVTCLTEGCAPVRWGDDGHSLYVYDRKEMPAPIYRVDLNSMEKHLHLELQPPDPVGVVEILRVLLTPDGQSYVYTYTRDLSELFMIRGLQA